MILKEFSDYIKSREALAESVSTSTADADKSGIFGNSAGSADATSTTKSTDAAGEAGAAGLTDAEKTTDFPKNGKTLPPQVKLSDGDSSTVFADSNTTANAKTSGAGAEGSEGSKELTDPTVGAGAPDPTNTTRKTDPATATKTPTITDSASAKNSANDIQNTKNSKTEERGKMLQNSREALSANDSEETREARGQDPVSRGVRQPQNSNFSCVKLLNEWLVKKLRSVPISNVDKIICNELFLATNKKGATLIIAKRESGRKLLRALYNFSLSYEHYRFARRTHEVRPSNFTNRKD